MTQQPQRTTLTAQASGPVRQYLKTEAGSAMLLVLALVAALGWANFGSDSYKSFWETVVSINVGELSLSLNLRHWLDEGAMALFFLIIGLEVRREWSIGELTDRRRAILPVVGALGGIVVPIAIYLWLNPVGEASRGWGMVIATDTAFLLGVLAIVGPRINTQLRIFLLLLSIVDDIIAISIIGIVYSDELNYIALGVAALALIGIWLVERIDLPVEFSYFVLGIILWIATLESGLHPTIAGMCAGLLVTAYTPRRSDVEGAAKLTRIFRQSPRADVAREAKRSVERSISPNERLITLLHPWSAYVIVPLFVLANAGVALDNDAIMSAVSSPVTWGVIGGLVAGKTIGISAFALGARRIKFGELPVGMGPGHLVGGAALSGIGFTVSLLIANLAFDDRELIEQATIGVLIAALISALIGWIAFVLAAKLRGETDAALPTKLVPEINPRRDRMLGYKNAPMVLVEYSDFECGFCSRATGMIDELREELGDNLLYVFRHLPLDDVHSNAVYAAEAAEAAGAQGKFWEMHDLLFENFDALEREDIARYAYEIGLDVVRFLQDLDRSRYGERVRADVASAEASGARGTPTFFVNGERHLGAYDTATLAEELRATRKPAIIVN